MILEIQHETRLEYTEPVSEWLTEVRMEPASDEHQSCHSFHLAVSQPATLFRYQDGFGNRVHHFNLLEPHQRVRILAASIVETIPAAGDLAGCRATFPLDRAAWTLSCSISCTSAAPVRRDAAARSRCSRSVRRRPARPSASWSGRCPSTFTNTSNTPATSPTPPRPSTTCSNTARASARTSPT